MKPFGKILIKNLHWLLVGSAVICFPPPDAHHFPAKERTSVTCDLQR